MEKLKKIAILVVFGCFSLGFSQSKKVHTDKPNGMVSLINKPVEKAMLNIDEILSESGIAIAQIKDSVVYDQNEKKLIVPFISYKKLYVNPHTYFELGYGKDKSVSKVGIKGIPTEAKPLLFFAGLNEAKPIASGTGINTYVFAGIFARSYEYKQGFFIDILKNQKSILKPKSFSELNGNSSAVDYEAAFVHLFQSKGFEYLGKEKYLSADDLGRYNGWETEIYFSNALSVSISSSESIKTSATVTYENTIVENILKEFVFSKWKKLEATPEGHENYKNNNILATVYENEIRFMAVFD